ncbi:MAG TPA: hypothetical protein VJ672_12225 [Gemmatimonadaceae bacterium]|nr:hypothetical protein [Gemmatimonadaceae bacterium]
MTRQYGGARRFGAVGRAIAAVLGLAILAAGSIVIVRHGWIGVLESLPALALGSTAIYMAAVGREPRWWRGS